MRPADQTDADCVALVRRGYDCCAQRYGAQRAQDDSDQLRPLTERLAPGARVLDLGCGAGVPIARSLAARHRVVGLDLSRAMLRLARAAVPAGAWVEGDLSRIAFRPASFDAVVMLFALFHVPRTRHGSILANIRGWLRPGGYLLATLTEAAEAPYLEDDFFGTTMYWSHFGWSEYTALLARAGFEILGGRIIGHGYGRRYRGRDERHPLLLARAS